LIRPVNSCYEMLILFIKQIFLAYSMKSIFLLLFSISFVVVYGEEPLVMEQLTSNGQVKVQLLWPEVEPDEIYGIRINFLDPNTDELLENVEINFAIAVTQHGSLIESYHDLQTEEGHTDFVVMFPEDDKGPAEVVIEVVSITTDFGTIQIDEEFTFNVEVIPEFEALAMVVLALSFVSLLFLARGKLKIKHFQ